MNKELEQKLLELINKIDSNLPDWANAIIEYNIGTTKMAVYISLGIILLCLIGIGVCSRIKDGYNNVKEGAWIAGVSLGIIAVLSFIALCTASIELYKWTYFTKAMLIKELL